MAKKKMVVRKEVKVKAKGLPDTKVDVVTVVGYDPDLPLRKQREFI